MTLLQTINDPAMAGKPIYHILFLLMIISSLASGQKWTISHSDFNHFLYHGIVACTPTENGNSVIGISYRESADARKSKLVFINSDGEEITEYVFPDEFNFKYIKALHYDGENIIVFFEDGNGTLIVKLSPEWEILQSITDPNSKLHSVKPYYNGYLLKHSAGVFYNRHITARDASLDRVFHFGTPQSFSQKALSAYPLHNGQVLIVSIEEYSIWPVAYKARCVLLNELGEEQTQYQIDDFDIGGGYSTLQVIAKDSCYELIYIRAGSLVRRVYSNDHELLNIHQQVLPRGLSVSKIFVYSNQRVLLIGYTDKQVFAYYSDQPEIISYMDLPESGYRIRSIHENEDYIIMLGQFQSRRTNALGLDKTNLFQDVLLNFQCKVINHKGDTVPATDGWIRLQQDQAAIKTKGEGIITQLYTSSSPLNPRLYVSGQWIDADTIITTENGEPDIILFKDPVPCPKVQLHLFGEDFVIKDTNTVTLLARNVGTYSVSDMNVKLKHSTDLRPISSSIQASQVQGDQLSWEISLSPGEVKYIHMKFVSDKKMDVGQLIEYHAYIPEMHECFSSSESFSKEDALQVVSSCIDNDQVCFEIKNLHQRGTVSADLDIYANAILKETNSLILAPGEVQKLIRNGLGATWYAEIVQPKSSHLSTQQSTLITGCGYTVSGFPSTGFHNKHKEVSHLAWQATLRRSATRFTTTKYVYNTDHLLPTEYPDIQQRVKSDLLVLKNNSDTLLPFNVLYIDFDSDEVLWEPIEVIGNRPIDFIVHREAKSAIIKPKEGGGFVLPGESLLVNITYLCRSDVSNLEDVSVGYRYALNYSFSSHFGRVRDTEFKEIDRVPPDMTAMFPILEDGSNMFYDIEDIHSLHRVLPDSKGGFVVLFESAAFNTSGINEWIIMRIDKAQRYQWHQSLNILDVDWVDHFLMMGENDELIIFTLERYNASDWYISPDLPRYFRIDIDGKMESGQLDWEDPSYQDYRIIQATKFGEHPVFIALTEGNRRIIGRANSDMKLEYINTFPRLEDRIVRASILGNIHDTLILEIVYNSDIDNSYYTEIQYLDIHFDVLKRDTLEESQHRFWLNQNSGLFRILSSPDETNYSHTIGIHTLNDSLQWFDFPDERSFVLRDQTPWNDGFITSIININDYQSFDLSTWYIDNEKLENLATYPSPITTKHLNIHCLTHSKDKLMEFNHVSSNEDVHLFYSTYFQPDFSSSVINKENENTPILKIHPNPSSSFFNISHFFDQAVTVSLFNTQGQLIHHSSYQDNPIRINIPSSWQPGVYHIRVNSETGYNYGKLVIEP